MKDRQLTTCVNMAGISGSVELTRDEKAATLFTPEAHLGCWFPALCSCLGFRGRSTELALVAEGGRDGEQGQGSTRTGHCSGSGLRSRMKGARSMSNGGGSIWTRDHRVLLAVLYICYLVNMIACSAVSVALPVLISDQLLGLGGPGRSRLLADGVLGFILGKIVAGRVTDVVGGERMISVSLGVMCVCLAAVGHSSSAGVLIPAWFLTRAFSASLWPAMGKLCRQAFGADHFAKAWGLLSTSSRVGALCGGLLLGPLLSVGGWRNVFLASSYLTLAASFLAASCLRPVRPAHTSSSSPLSPPCPSSSSLASNVPPPPLLKAAATRADNSSPFRSTSLSLSGSGPSLSTRGSPSTNSLLWHLTSPRLLLLLTMEMCLLLLLDMTQILPSFLSEVTGLTPAMSARAASACPLGGAVAVLVIGWLHDRLSRRARATLFTSCLGVSLASLCLLGVPSVASTSPRLIVALLFAFGASLAPVKYLVAPVYCASLGGGQHTATLLSWLDVPGFLALGVFYREFSLIMSAAGWPGVFHVFGLANAVAFVAHVGFWSFDLKQPASSSKQDNSQWGADYSNGKPVTSGDLYTV